MNPQVDSHLKQALGILPLGALQQLSLCEFMEAEETNPVTIPGNLSQTPKKIVSDGIQKIKMSGWTVDIGEVETEAGFGLFS